MKYIFIAFLVGFSGNFSFGQGMIDDIMLVETVSMDLSEVNEKLMNKYNETLQKETTSMETDLAKIDKKYQEEVAGYINDFTKKLKDGEEQVVTNLKKITVSRVNSLTMTHKADKKNRVQTFLNKMQLANRRLPLFLRENSSARVKDTGLTHFDTFDRDYNAHIVTIKAFEAQEHLIVTEGEGDTVLVEEESMY